MLIYGKFNKCCQVLAWRFRSRYHRSHKYQSIALSNYVWHFLSRKWKGIIGVIEEILYCHGLDSDIKNEVNNSTDINISKYVKYEWHLLQGRLLLSWFNFDPRMDMGLHLSSNVGLNYLCIPNLDLQRYNHWYLGIDKQFHPTFYRACDYLSMLGLKLFHFIKSDPSSQIKLTLVWLQCGMYTLMWFLITMTLHKRHGESNHSQFDCLFHSLPWLTTNETQKLHDSDPLWGESTDDQISPHKWPIIVKAFPCHGIPASLKHDKVTPG